MAFRPGKGIGEGAAWAVGPATNAFSGADKAAAKTSLDNYTADANNATWLAVYDARPAFMVRLVWPVQTPTNEAFFARVNSTWVEVTPVLRGLRGIQGLQGAGVPPVSGDDNGSVLRVVAGAWAKVASLPASIIGSGTFAAARIPTITLGKLSAAVRARLLPTGASTGQVARWDGDAWVPGNAGGAGGSPAVESPSAEAKAGTDSAAANATRMTPRRTKEAIEAQAVVPADFTPKESDLWFLWASSHQAWASATNAKGSITYYTGPPNASTFVPDLAQADRAVDASTITHIRMSKFAFPDTNYLLTPTADVPRPSGTLYQHPDQPYYGNILGTFVVGNVTEGGSGDAAYWEFSVIGTGTGFWAGPNTFIRNTDEIPGTVTVPGSQVQLNDAFLSRLRTLNTFAATLATSLTGFLGIASTGRTSLITALGAFLVKRTDLTGLSGDTFSTWATTADFLAASDKRGLWSIATIDGGAPDASHSQALSAVSSGNATFLYGAPWVRADGTQWSAADRILFLTALINYTQGGNSGNVFENAIGGAFLRYLVANPKRADYNNLLTGLSNALTAYNDFITALRSLIQPPAEHTTLTGYTWKGEYDTDNPPVVNGNKQIGEANPSQMWIQPPAANVALVESYMRKDHTFRVVKDASNYIDYKVDTTAYGVGAGTQRYIYWATKVKVGTIASGDTVSVRMTPPFLTVDQSTDTVRPAATATDLDIPTEAAVRKAIDGQHANVSDFPPVTYLGYTIDTSGIDQAKEIRKVGNEWQVNPGGDFTDFRTKIIEGSRIVIRKDGSNFETGVVYSSYVSGSSVHFTLSEDAQTGTLPDASTVSITIYGHLVAWDDVQDAIRASGSASDAKIATEAAVRGAIDNLTLPPLANAPGNPADGQVWVDGNGQPYIYRGAVKEDPSRRTELTGHVGTLHGLIVHETRGLAWAIDRSADKLIGLRIRPTGPMVRAPKFDHPLQAANDAPVGGGRVGDILFVADNGDHKAFGYKVTDDGVEDATTYNFDFDGGNRKAQAMLTNGNIIRVIDSGSGGDGKGYGYTFAEPPTRTSAKDVDIDSDAGNIHGAWGTPTQWGFVDFDDDKNYGYSVNNDAATRDTDDDWDLASLNTQPSGADTDGHAVYVGDANGDRIHVYPLKGWYPLAILLSDSALPVDASRGQLDDAPDVPETNGNYKLRAVRSNTGVAYSWVTDS